MSQTLLPAVPQTTFTLSQVGDPAPSWGPPREFLCQDTAQTQDSGPPLWGWGGPHSSLWSGLHWGESFSSSTPLGAHTQGSWVSHCHLTSWV